MMRDQTFTGAGIDRVDEVGVGGKTASQRHQLALEDLGNPRQDIDIFELHSREAGVTGRVEDGALGNLGHFEAGRVESARKVLLDDAFEFGVDDDFAAEGSGYRL